MKIHIIGNFFVNAGPKNFILIEEYEGKTKTGEPRKGKRFIGSYNKISAAVHECLHLNVLNGAEAVELWEYAKMVEESNKTLAESLGKLMEALFEKGESDND